MAKRTAPRGKDMRLPQNRPQDPTKINNEISAKEVRLIAEGIEPGVYSIQRALEIAAEANKDLVEIAPNAVPPVCKVIDYSRYLFEKKKKEKEIKAKATKSVVKEVRFGPNTDEHDFEFKLKHAESFIEENSKVRAYVHFRGRAIVFKDRGEILLKRFAEALDAVAKVESPPKLEGKRMFMLLAPKAAPTKKPAPAPQAASNPAAPAPAPKNEIPPPKPAVKEELSGSPQEPSKEQNQE